MRLVFTGQFRAHLLAYGLELCVAEMPADQLKSLVDQVGIEHIGFAVIANILDKEDCTTENTEYTEKSRYKEVFLL